MDLQVFVTEVNSHRDQIIELDKTGTHLKYFSQKQDVVLIKNLLLSVQGRWEKVVQRSVERGRLLDDARKRAKQVRKSRGIKLISKPCFFNHTSLLDIVTVGMIESHRTSLDFFFATSQHNETL